LKESVLQSKFLRKFNSIAFCKAINIPGGSNMERGTPDIIGCYKGIMFGVEVKTGSYQPTPIQLKRLKEWYEVGGYTTIAREDFDIPKFLEAVQECSLCTTKMRTAT